MTDPGAQLEIGRALEHARQEQGLSFEQVEHATKIRAVYLRELERGNFGVLPPAFVRGFLKTYANFLRLDGEALAQELGRQQAYQRERQARRAISTERHTLAEGEGKEGSKVVGGLWRLISARITLGSFLGYLCLAAFLGLGLPLVVLAATLMEPDGKPVPMRAHAAGRAGDQGVRSHLRGKGDEPGTNDQGSSRPRDQRGGDEGDRQVGRDAKEEPVDAMVIGVGSSTVAPETAPSSPPAAATSSATSSASAAAAPTAGPAATAPPSARDALPVQGAATNAQSQTPLEVKDLSVPNASGTEIAPDAAATPIGRPLRSAVGPGAGTTEGLLPSRRW